MFYQVLKFYSQANARAGIWIFRKHGISTEKYSTSSVLSHI